MRGACGCLPAWSARLSQIRFPFRTQRKSLLLTEQPLDEVFGFDAVIRGIEPRFKGQHVFFVVIADTLQRCKLPFPHVLAHHGLRYLDILFLVGSRCDEIHLRIANLANRYIIAPAKQFKVNYNVFKDRRGRSKKSRLCYRN